MYNAVFNLILCEFCRPTENLKLKIDMLCFLSRLHFLLLSLFIFIHLNLSMSSSQMEQGNWQDQLFSFSLEHRK